MFARRACLALYARQETPRLASLVSHGHKVRSHSFLNATACPKTTLRIPFQGSQYGPGKSRDPDPSVGREAWAHNRWLAGSHRVMVRGVEPHIGAFNPDHTLVQEANMGVC